MGCGRPYYGVPAPDTKGRSADMNETQLFYELYESLPRGGPGDNESTRKAYSFLSSLPRNPIILDIGCGYGVQTIEVAKISHGTIYALDNHKPFLDGLAIQAKKHGLEKSIIMVHESMEAMHFSDEFFDVIWSEGALYQMGFVNGLKKCHALLKKSGYLVVSEAVYFLDERPQEVIEFWQSEYPAITSVEHNIQEIKLAGYRLVSHFPLPAQSWIDYFYAPMETEIHRLKEKYRGLDWAQAMLEKCRYEINIYKKFSSYFGYEFFIMQK
jgi:ubiquinone/menaquinone biosynthesis C-methylase UbiE